MSALSGVHMPSLVNTAVVTAAALIFKSAYHRPDGPPDS